MQLSCTCISTYIQLLCLAVAQRTVDLVSLLSNWQVGTVIPQILSGEDHLNDVISWGIGKLYRKIVVLDKMLIACEMMYTCEMYLAFENL